MEKLLNHFKANPNTYRAEIELLEKLETAKEGDMVLFVSKTHKERLTAYNRIRKFLLGELSGTSDMNFKLMLNEKVIKFEVADIEKIKRHSFVDFVTDCYVTFDIQPLIKNRT